MGIFFFASGICLGVVGWVVCFASRKKPLNIIGFLMILGGVVSVGYSAKAFDDAAEDRARRTSAVVGSAVEVFKILIAEPPSGKIKCTWRFQIKFREDDGYKRLPHTFEVKCDTDVRHGDVLRVTFVAPKKPEGRPEVLEFLNFTLETELHSRPPSSPPAEAPVK